MRAPRVILLSIAITGLVLRFEKAQGVQCSDSIPLTAEQHIANLEDLVSKSISHPEPITASLRLASYFLARAKVETALKQLHIFQNRIRSRAFGQAVADFVADSEAIMNSIQKGGTSLVVSAVSPFEIDLAWPHHPKPEASIRVERSSNGLDFVQIAELLPQTHRYRDRHLLPSKNFHYRIRTVYKSGASSLSPVQAAYTPGLPCPVSAVTWPDYGGELAADVIAIGCAGKYLVELHSDGTISAPPFSNIAGTPPSLTNIFAVAAGDYHGVALRETGAVVVWGNNYHQQTNIPAGLTNVEAIAASGDYTLALRQDGTVIGWGYSPEGATGPPPGLGGVVAISAGPTHALAARSDGTVAAWGSDDNGEIRVPSHLSDVVDVCAGSHFSMALKCDGTVVAWGSIASPPTGLSEVIALAAGEDWAAALKLGGQVVIWGEKTDSPSGLSQVFQMAIQGSSLQALTMAPLAPSLSPMLTASNMVSIWCHDPSPEVSNYLVERSTNGYSDWIMLGEVAGMAGKPVLDFPVSLNATNWYRARARNECGVSRYSSPNQVPITPPEMPSLTSAVLGESNSVELRWSEPFSGTEKYFVQRALDEDGSPGLWTNGFFVATNTQLSDTLVSSGATYWYRVCASNALGASSFSEPWAVKVFAPPPIQALRLFILGTKVRISWDFENVPFGTIQGCHVERATDENGHPGSWSFLATVQGQSYTDSGVSPQNKYWYRVEAFNWVGNSDFASVVTDAIAAAATPGDLRAAMGPPNSVNLKWRSADAEQDGFKIERTVVLNGELGTWTQIATVLATNSSDGFFADGNVMAGLSYSYRVRAFNANGHSEYCVPIVINASAPQEPSARITLFTNMATIYWWTETAGYKCIVVERASDISGLPGEWKQVLTEATSLNEGVVADSALTGSETYWYRIRATNWAGASDYSAPFSVTIIPPEAPSQLQAWINSSNYLRLTWLDSKGDEAGFYIERAADVSSSPGKWIQIGAVSASNAHKADFVDKSARADRSWWYRVRAFNNVGLSAYSETCRIELKPPTQPWISEAKPIDDTVSLAWALNYPGDLASVIVERAPDIGGAAGAWRKISIAQGNRTSFFDRKVTPGTAYWYRIQARNWLGASPFSEPVSVLILPPSPPNDLQARVGSTNQVMLSWHSSSQEYGFTVQSASDVAGSPGDWRAIGIVAPSQTNEIYFVHTNALSNTTNWYRVSTIGPSGFSEFGAPCSVEIIPPPAPAIRAEPFAASIRLTFALEDYSVPLYGFNIERAQDSGGAPGRWEFLAKEPSASFSDTNLALGATWWYRARSFNWVGESTNTAPVSATVVPPSSPTAYAAMGSSNNVIVALYPAAPYDQNGYVLERKTGSEEWIEIGTVKSRGSASYLFSDLKVSGPNTNWYRARAFNSLGLSTYSSPAVVNLRAPEAPTWQRYEIREGPEVFLAWEDEGSGIISGLRVERALDFTNAPGPWSVVTNLSPAALYYEEGPQKGFAYWYRIVTSNWVGKVASSEVRINYAIPSIPSHVTATNDLRNQIQLTWELADQQQQINSVELQRAPGDGDGPGSWSLLQEIPAWPYSYEDTTVEGGKEYWYRLRARNFIGNSGFCEPISARVVGESVIKDSTTTSSTTFSHLAIRQAGSGWELTWLSIPGRTNFVQAASSFTGTFSNISPPLVAPSNAPVLKFVDKGILTAAPARYYRIHSD